MLGCRGNNEVRLRVGVARFTTLLNQKSPLKHDVFGNLKHSIGEHWSHFMIEPIVEL